MTDETQLPESTPQERAPADPMAKARAARAAKREQAKADAAQRDQARADGDPDGLLRADGTRRRRKSLDGMRDARLDDALTVEQDHENYVYRWASDDPGRIEHLHRIDWDPVPDQARVPVGLNRYGQPKHKVLMRKRKDDWTQDQKARNERQNRALAARVQKPLETDEMREAAGRFRLPDGSSPFYTQPQQRSGPPGAYQP